MIIAGQYIELNVANEIEDIVKTSLVGSRMRELSHIQK